MNINRYFLFIVFLLGSIFQVKSNPTYRIKSISGNYGLSQKSVHTIIRDHVGYIWMGTAHGLNRFDGKEVKKYFHDSEDNYSISSDNISLIHEDSDGNLWITTPEGINRYDRENDRFIRYVFSKSLRTSCIFETENELWFPDTSWKFHIYDKKNKRYSDREIIPQFSHTKDKIYIDQIEVFDKDHLLIGTYYSGLFLLNKTSGELSEFCQFSNSGFQGIEILDEFIYCATFSNVYQISKSGKVLQVFNEQNSGLKSHLILDVEYREKDGTLWISTDGAGIQMFDKDFNLVNTLQVGPNSSDILPDNSINDVTIIQDGIVLLGTVRSGGIILYPSDFDQFSYSNQSKFGPSDKTVTCFYEDQDENLWIGTDGGGLNLFNRQTLTFEHFSTPDVQKITSVTRFSKDLLLVASYTKGLFFFNKKTGRFTNAHNHPLLKNVRKGGKHSLFRDSKNRLWISDGRLWKVNIQDQTSQVYTTSNSPQYFQNISPIFNSAIESNDGAIWFSSYGGLYSYSIKQDKFADRIHLANTPNSFGRTVNSVVEDQIGNLIFGTNKGLLHYDFNAKRISDYIADPKYRSLMYLSLFFDQANHLWIGTNEGLLRMTKNDSTKEIFMFNALGNEGGLEYFPGSILKSKNGLLYFGSNEGITCFDPQKTQPYIKTPRTVITSFSRLTSDKDAIKDSILAINVFKDHSLVLDYSSSSYRFNFNAFDIPFSESTEYSYKLEPFEEIWHTAKGNNAIYSNLPAGEYSFRVKARNRNGIWSNETTNIHLEILPPWWKTGWFRISLLLIILTIIYIVWRASLERVKLQQELQVKKREQEQLQEINQMKLRFFTNISHELKTPLTLIFSPLEHLVKKGGSEQEFRSLLPFLYRNAHRMTLLIDQILDFRKSEMSVLKLMVSKGDLVSSCREILTYFKHQAGIENIQLKFEHSEESIEAWYDNDKLFKIVSNLISNALKNTPAKGDISVSVFNEDNNAIIEVKDSGNGIAAEELESIFERYYQVGKKIRGTGIGLALTKRLVDLHKGDIKVKSAPGQGATFTVSLPLGNNHFAQEDFATKPVELPIPKEQPEIIETDVANIQSGNVSILIVEDEWELREYMTKLLSSSFSVTTAKNGKEALKFLSTNEPDLVISDVMMPQMDGIEFCKILKSDLRISHIPVIMLTAKTSIESRIEGLKSGADAYIPKPFNTQLLFSQIESILTNRKIMKERFSHDLGLKTKEVTQSSADEKFLHKAISIVEKNMENPKFDVAVFVEQMAMSRTLVYNKTKAITGKPIKDFIINIKLRKAADLLKNSDKPVSEIALLCGFADPAYFSVVFKRYFKQSPTEFRSGE